MRPAILTMLHTKYLQKYFNFSSFFLEMWAPLATPGPGVILPVSPPLDGPAGHYDIVL